LNPAMTPRAAMQQQRLVTVAGLLGLLSLCAAPLCAAAVSPVSLVADEAPPPPAQYAMGKLKAALQQQGVPVAEARRLSEASGPMVVVAGLSSGAGDAARLAAELKLTPPTEPESFLIRKLSREGQSVVLAAGADARGLMYALLEVAERVGWAKSREQPLSEVREAQAKPFAPERAL
jgi:hypothetical protein